MGSLQCGSSWAKYYVKYDRHDVEQYMYFFQAMDEQVNPFW